MARDAKTPDRHDDASTGALVPLYGGTDIVPGIQAFRRGDMVLYSVRGEPNEVLELMAELDRQGVGEVVAFISHRAAEEPESTGEDDG